MTDWQPIETAPTDGTEVMLSEGWRVNIGYFEVTVHRTNGKETYRHVGWRYRSASASLRAATPTHWMPLPEPARS